MKRAKPRYLRCAAWLGVAALALNALVPIHIAFDLAAAFGAATPSLLAELTGHHHADGHSHDHADGHSHDHSGGKPHDHGKTGGHTACAVCLAVAALAGFAPASAIPLPLPPATVAAVAVPATGGTLTALPLGYRSRAPPSA